ncbi:MAG: septum formation initiator family protein [Dehalococcoidia bacterium]|jgi:cell division protein FtsL
MSALDRLIARPLPRPLPRITGVRPALLIAFLVVASVGLLQVFQISNATTNDYTLQQLEQEQFDKQAEVHQLEAEVSLLTSIDRIDQEARGRLGMVPATSTMTLEVHKQPPAEQLVPLRFITTSSTAKVESRSWWQKLLGMVPLAG